MKKLVYILGVIFLTIIVVLNIALTANLNTAEQITIHYHHWLYGIGVIGLAVLLYFFTQILQQHLPHEWDEEAKKKNRKKTWIIVLGIYILFQAIWAIMVNPNVIGDSVHVCNLAQTFYRGNEEEFLSNMTYAGISLREYMQAYPQQITLAFVFSIFFRFIHFDIMEVLRVCNVIGNIGIVIALYKINQQLAKKYETNKARLFTWILAFVSLPMLLTFIYGDIPSLALCLFSVYWMMRYTETKKLVYPIVASIFTMIAYMMRMNSLIFIIATVLYLLAIWLKEISKKTGKEMLMGFGIILLYVVISIMPASLLKSYYFNKYDLDKNKTYPTVSYLLMAMEESTRGNGWYNEEIARPALQNPEGVKEEYMNRIKDRLCYFSENIGEAFQFYTMKIASMWAENTYSAIQNNTLQENTVLENMDEPLTFYQKALLLVICVCCLVVVIQNRKNLSMEMIFLLMIFVGGFLFHLLWEAKSRYIIPYIVVLIPIASIQIRRKNRKENTGSEKIK